MTRYVTLAEFLGMLDIAPGTLDSLASAAIGAAEETIDGWCGRRFDVAGATPTARPFTATSELVCVIDDATAVTAVATDLDGDGAYETTWASSDYRAWPAVAGRPYTRVLVAPVSGQRFPAWPAGVQVTATWGWPATPQAVREATLILASRLLKRAREAPFGVAPLVALEGGGIQLRNRLDPDVEVLLGAYRRFDL